MNNRFYLSPLFYLKSLIFLPIILHGQETIRLGKNADEPTVVLAPSISSNKIVAAANIDQLFYLKKGTGNFKNIKAKSSLGVYGDPVLHYSNHDLFFAHLSRTPNKKYGDWFDRIVVQRIHSLDPWIESSYSVGYNPPKMQDKPWLSSDNHSKKFKGNVYVTWTEFDKYDSKDSTDFSRIQFSKYVPKYDSFSRAITISDTVGDCKDGDNTLEGATTAVGLDGEIYAVWAGHDKIWFDKSKDGGDTWGKDQEIASQIKGWDMEMPNIFRANGMPFVVCDTTREIIYITWADEENGNADVWLVYSKDKGVSWTKKICINETKGHQYFPNITLNQEDGDVYIAYYDQSLSSKSLFYDISLSRFNIENPNQNELFRITSKSVPLPGKYFFYGDYIDLDYQDDTLVIIYPIFNNKNSAIELFVSHRKELRKIKEVMPISHSLMRTKDSIQWAVNIQKPCTISYKINQRKNRRFKIYTFKKTCSFEAINHDFILYTGSIHRSTKINYKIRDIQNNQVIDRYKGRIINIIR